MSGLHLPREEGRPHRSAQRPHEDGQLCGLEPGLPPGECRSLVSSLETLTDLLLLSDPRVRQ